MKVIVPGSQTTTTLQNLRPAQTYYIRVLAENRLGLSEPSKEIQVSTLEEGNCHSHSRFLSCQFLGGSLVWLFRGSDVSFTLVRDIFRALSRSKARMTDSRTGNVFSICSMRALRSDEKGVGIKDF